MLVGVELTEQLVELCVVNLTAIMSRHVERGYEGPRLLRVLGAQVAKLCDLKWFEDLWGIQVPA